MRAIALVALLVTNGFATGGAARDARAGAFAGDDPPRVTNGRPARVARPASLAALGGWQALRDADLGTIIRMWGATASVPGASADPAIAERAARSFLAAHLAALAPGARIGDFILASNRVDGELRTVAYHQTWNGLRVVGGQLHVVISRDRIFAAGGDALPLAGDLVTVGRPRANSGRAETWLRDAVKRPVTLRATGERVVLPIVRGANDVAYHVADVHEATARDEWWTVYVALDGEPLLRDSRLHRATGTLRFDVPERRPTSTRMLAPAPNASLVVSGVATVTGDSGVFDGTLPGTVEPTASGTFVTVVDDAGAPVTAQLAGQPDGNVDWSLASDARGDAQLSAFVFASVAKTRARAMHPGLAWLDQQLAVHVNGAGACNAFSTGDDLHFVLGSAECENTARLADVVLHEFGHSFHNQSMIPGVGAFDLSLSEGVSDFFAANITGDPGVGRGMTFDDTPVRELDPAGFERTFPDDLSGSIHRNGLIVAGALWDLRTALIAKHGDAAGIAATERVLVGILQRANDLATAYAAALIADDDDGDLGNGTPNHCELEVAFGRHGLVPGFTTPRIERPVTTGRTVAVAVTPSISPAGCPAPAVAGIDLEWQIGDGAGETIALVDHDHTWSAALPSLPNGTVVRYRVVARIDDGTGVVYPDNPADPLYQLFVGEATPIWCDRLDAAPGWTETGLSWEYARPRGHAGDPDVAYTGEAFLGTNIIGSGQYPAGQSTSITTPAIDANGFAQVHVQFRRWLTIDDRAFDRAAIGVGGVTVWENATGTPRLEHLDREWRFVDLEVPAGEFAITWSITADADRERGGWNLDDVCVVGVGPSDCADPPCLPPLDEAAGCCSSSDPRGSGLGLVVLLLIVRRRQRR